MTLSGGGAERLVVREHAHLLVGDVLRVLRADRAFRIAADLELGERRSQRFVQEQATEVVKLIIGAGDPLIGRLLMYDALAATTTELKVRRDPECPICSRDPEAISDEEMRVFPDYEAFCAAAG